MGTLLATYLNDHLAGATVGRELARRAAASNRGSPLGEVLDQLSAEIDEDRETLIGLMASLGIGADRLKVLGAWGAEKIGRLKLNGRLLGYSPLSRLVELEGLLLGVRGKLALWLALQEIEDEQAALGAVGLAALIDRAQAQIETLEPHRLRAAREALAG